MGFLAYVLFSGSMEIVYGDASFTVETGSWDDSCDACVVLTVNSETVVINGPDPEATRAIYQQLLEHR